MDGEYVVYDPQNHIGFRDTNSKAQHLALMLNKNGAMMLSKNVSDAVLAVISGNDPGTIFKLERSTMIVERFF